MGEKERGSEEMSEIEGREEEQNIQLKGHPLDVIMTPYLYSPAL